LYEGYESVARLGFDGFGLGLLLIISFPSGYRLRFFAVYIVKILI
jgi:hypothetical protein